MKKILLSVSVIAVVAAVVLGVTTAFFSDTETSTGNTFTAGAIDLTIDSRCSYNGELQSGQCGNWGLKDLVPASDKFFNFADIKPGDSGENTISLHVINNDAWVCAEVSNLVSNDNGLTEPESAVDQTGGSGQGELQNAMIWTVWKDDGAGQGIAGDNVRQPGEQILASGHPVNGVLAVYDSTTVGGPLTGGSTTYLGVEWSLPIGTGNEVQTDSLTGDISFKVEQARNNANFVCTTQGPTQKTLILDNKNPQGWTRITNDNKLGTLTYQTAGDTFNYTFEATGLTEGVSYSLIYYADQQNRYTNWGGNSPGAVIGTFIATGGIISSGAMSINLGIDLPDANDWNFSAAANYCIAPDNYSMCRGAKIWLVPSSDYDTATKALTAWNPSTYLFETDLIVYNDTNN